MVTPAAAALQVNKTLATPITDARKVRELLINGVIDGVISDTGRMKVDLEQVKDHYTKQIK